MEYIEQKPVEEKPHAKRNKIIISSVIAALTLGAVGVGYYFLIDKIFLDFENIEIYDYSYIYDENKNITGTIINSLKDDAEVPAHLRIPRKLGGYPVVELAPNSCQYFQTIESVDLPDTIKVIGAEAFRECINLSSFNAPNDLEEIGTDAFTDTKWLEDQEDGLVMIGKFLYTYKGDIEEETILIGKQDSELLDLYPEAEVLDLSQFNHMSDGVFKEKNAIKAVEYPESFDKVNNDTFTSCMSLEKVILPASIKTIGDNAFQSCAITELPALTNVYKIGDNAFAFNPIAGEITIPESVHSIGAGVFRKNRQLTKVTVPGTIDSIPSSAFEECSKLEEIVFPDSEYVASTSHIKTIGANSFKNTKLSSIKIPYNVNTLGDKAFEGCTLLTGIELYNNTTATKFINRVTQPDGTYSDWRVNDNAIQGALYMGDGLFNGDELLDEVVLVDSQGNKTPSHEVHIPVTVTSLGSKSISGGSKIFSLTKVNKIDFSQKPTAAVAPFITTPLNYVAPSIAENAPELVDVVFGDNSTIASINSNAFRGCSKLENLIVPSSVISIADGVFDGCTSLGSGLAFQDGFSTTSYKEYVFRNTKITSISVPSVLADIEKGAFEGCTELLSVTFEPYSQLTKLGSDIFKGCSKLNSIVLPSDFVSIGSSAFEGCSELTTMNLSRNIKVLPAGLFKGCSKLTSLKLNADTVVAYQADTFEGCSSLTTILVPESRVSQYQADPNWSGYTITAITD